METKKTKWIAKLLTLMLVAFFMSPLHTGVVAKASSLATTKTGETPSPQPSQPTKSDNFEVSMGADGTVTIGDSTQSSDSAWNVLFAKYKGAIAGITGILALTCLVIFIISCTKFAASGDNPQTRKNATTALWVSGLGIALLGGASLFVGLFWNALV